MLRIWINISIKHATYWLYMCKEHPTILSQREDIISRVDYYYLYAEVSQWRAFDCIYWLFSAFKSHWYPKYFLSETLWLRYFTEKLSLKWAGYFQPSVILTKPSMSAHSWSVSNTFNISQMITGSECALCTHSLHMRRLNFNNYYLHQFVAIWHQL